MEYDHMMKELKATISPSIDIANSALALAANRCDDLDLPPAICFILLRELADMNARSYIAQKQKMVNNVLSKLPPELLKNVPGGKDLDMYKEINGMILELLEVAPLKEEQLG